MAESELVWMGIRAEELRRLLVDFHNFYYENHKGHGIALYRNVTLHHYLLSVPPTLKKLAASWFNTYQIAPVRSFEAAETYWIAGDIQSQRT